MVETLAPPTTAATIFVLNTAQEHGRSSNVTLSTILACALGLTAITVDERHRPAYHAGAVLSAGGVVALASAAVEALGVAGIDEEEALAALLPLMKSAIAGLERRGLPDALTGPVVRGDAEALKSHLLELPKAVAPLYRELMTRSLQLARGNLSPAKRREIARALR